MAQEAEGTPEAGEQSDPESTPQEGTQESKQFSEDYVKQLRGEAAKWRTEAQEAKGRVEEFETRDQSEAEKLAGQRDKFKTDAEQHAAENLRLRVALDKQLPSELIDRLKGDSQEELEADADALMALVKPAATPTPDFGGGVREPAPENKTPEQGHNDFLKALLSGTST